MITAWGVLNAGLASGIPATMAAAVTTFNGTMASLITSWGSIAAAHTLQTSTTIPAATALVSANTAEATNTTTSVVSVLNELETIIEGTADNVE